MSRFDPRIVRVGVEVDGQIKTYGEGFDIRVSGSKMANPSENACEVTISNLTKETRNYILTETSPFNRNRTPKRIIVEIGRASAIGQQTEAPRPRQTVSGGTIPNGMIQEGNIDLNNRPTVRNADGSISTVRSISIEIEGNTVLIPTVTQDGRLVDDEEAIRIFEETGENLGTFSNAPAAEAYAESLHGDQERMYATPRPGSGQAPLTRIFVGEIVSSSPSQPPDIALTIKALTKTYDKGIVVARNGQERELLSAIAARVASDLALSLDFQATDKTIANYAFTGAKLRQVDHLELAGGVDCFVDDDKLVVKDAGAPLVERVTTLSARSGLVGVPEATERGVKVTFVLDSAATLGGALKLESELNPALSGDYTIFKLDFEAATRDTPFYWMAEASRNGYTPPKDPPTRRRRAGAPT